MPAGRTYKVVNNFKGFPGIKEEVRKAIHAARQVGREEFVKMSEEELEERIEGHQKQLTNK